MVKATLNALVDRLSLTSNDASLSLKDPQRLKTEILAGLTVALADGRVREDVPFENYVYYRQLLEEMTRR